MSAGNIIGGVAIVGMAGVATYFGVKYFREGQQGNARFGPAAPPAQPPPNPDQVRVGTEPQQRGPGDNTAAQVQQWGNMLVNLFGQASSVYQQYWG